MANRRFSRTAACLLTISAIIGGLGPSLAGAIAIPPAPAAPGWGMVVPLSTAQEEPYAFTAQPDGSFQALATAERDTVTGIYNLTVYTRTVYGFEVQPLMQVASFTGMHLVSTQATDRMAMFATLAQPAGQRGVYMAFLSPGSYPMPVLVSDTAAIQSARLAADAAGNVMAMWMTYNGTYGLYANHSQVGAGFDGSVPVLAGATGLGNYELVAVDADTFLAVWGTFDGSTSHLWASRFTNASGWSAPEEIAPVAEAFYQVAAAGSAVAGRGAVAWWWGDNVNATLSVTVYDGQSWLAPEDVAFITGPGVNAGAARLAVDALGNVHLAWGEMPELSSVSTLSYRQRSAAGAWGEGWTREVATVSFTSVAAAADGGAAVMWTAGEPSGHRRAYVARYVPDSGWREAYAFDQIFSPLHRVSTLMGVLASGGNFTGVWMNGDDNRWELYMRDFTAGNDPPALSISAPSEGASTSLPTVTVAGTTSPGAKVVVDGLVADVAADGSFAVRVALPAGSHRIEVYAVDAWGNSARASVNVSYADPIPDLEVQLASAEANASAAAAEALLAHEAAHVVQQRANASDARAANLSQQLNDSAAIYQHQQSDLDFLRAQAASSANATQAAQSSVGTATALGAVGLLAGIGGIAMSLMRRPGGGGGGGGGGSGGGEMRTSGPAQQQQGAEPAGKGGPTQEPGPPPRPGAAPPAGDSTGGVKQTMQTQV